MGRWYKRCFAWLYHTFLSVGGWDCSADMIMHDLRAPLLARARGDVLEVGAGDGGNLSLYPAGARLTLLEPNPYLLNYLQETVQRLNLSAELVEAEAESMPFDNDSFDVVVAVHVLCSVRDQPRALAEIRRVLRPGGMFLFLEHVSAPPGTPTFALQRLANPVWRRVGDGCHLTRDTAGAIRMAGFRQVSIEDYHEGALPIVAPHIVGWAEG
jgi:ubiquinone/menaquinone biosynthesis C-methylase UbiE